jgi:hypothetical protein
MSPWMLRITARAGRAFVGAWTSPPTATPPRDVANLPNALFSERGNPFIEKSAFCSRGRGNGLGVVKSLLGEFMPLMGQAF